MKKASVAIIVLNWKNGKDTIACINSIHRQLTGEYLLVVVDNASDDDSFFQIREELLKKYHKLNEVVVLDNGDFFEKPELSADPVLIKNSINSGYAGGNNVAIKWLYDFESIKAYWILNNDCLIQSSEAIGNIVSTIHNSERIGFLGSVILDNKMTLQCYGGARIYPYLGKTKLVGKGLQIDQIKKLHKKLECDYLSGASLIATREMAGDIGLMNETYFMYGEEMDWQKRALARGWQFAVAEQCIVCHMTANEKKSAYMYLLASRGIILYIKRFHGPLAAVVASVSLLMLSALVLMKDLPRLRAVFNGIRQAFSMSMLPDYQLPQSKIDAC